MTQQVAQAVMAFQKKTTGHAPKAVSVVLAQDTLVVTLHEGLSPAERDMAKSLAGAAKVQEFHRQLFFTSSQPLREEIQKITGVKVRGAVAEVEPSTGAVVCAFASGTMVQVFQLARADARRSPAQRALREYGRRRGASRTAATRAGPQSR
jgi:uncharacterized protein YbcI